MALIFRTFRARPGRHADLVDALRGAALEMLESQPGSVAVCRTADPQELVWIGERGAEGDFGRWWESLKGTVADSSPAWSLRFLDAWYRFPAPPCQVWSFEVQAPRDGQLGVLKDLLGVLRWEQRDPQHVVGRSIYRAAEDPGVFIGFVGLTRGWLTEGAVAPLSIWERLAPLTVWRPLSVAYHLARIGGGVTRVSGGDGGSRTPFWPRSPTLPTPSMTGVVPKEDSVAAPCGSPR